MSKYNYKIIATSLIPLLLICSSLANAKAIPRLDSPDPAEGGIISAEVYGCSDLLFNNKSLDNNACSEKNKLTAYPISVIPL